MLSKRKCFVLMPFDKKLEDVFDYAILPAAEATDFDCFRADHALGPKAIIRDIIESIFMSDVIVADISDLNPNVLYELGVAHAIGNKTIIICDQEQKLPFNLNAYRVIFYSKTIDGIERELRRDLEHAMRELPTFSKKTTNPVQDFRPVHYTVPLLEQAELEKKIEDLTSKIQRCEDEKARLELRTILLALPEIQIKHLRNLIAPREFTYNKINPFLDELRALRYHGLIRHKDENMKMRDIPSDGKDLKLYLEVTEPARHILEGLMRLFSPPDHR